LVGCCCCCLYRDVFTYSTSEKKKMMDRCVNSFWLLCCFSIHPSIHPSIQQRKIGPNGQDLQQGVVPNSAGAEELATAQFNAAKKEAATTTSESRGSFFRRRRPTHRRSKSLGRVRMHIFIFLFFYFFQTRSDYF
jgi:tight junction protein 1